MKEEQLQEIFGKDAIGLYPSFRQVLRGGDERSNATVADVRALIAEVRRLRELVDDEKTVYLTPAELAPLQRQKNAEMSKLLDGLRPGKPAED